MTRRTVLQTLLASGALFRIAASRNRGPRIGVTDWNLQLTGKIEAVALAAKLGFDGVQVSLGRTPVSDKLPLDDGGIQSQYLAAAKQYGIALSGTCLDILHVDHLKDNQRAQKWVADSIPITANLKAEVVLLPFFGKASLANHAEMDYVAGVLKELAPAAEKAGVLSFVLDGVRTEAVGGILDQEGIAVRSGHHCAQPILRRFGLESTVRASLAPYNTREDIDALVRALHRIQVGDEIVDPLLRLGLRRARPLRHQSDQVGAIGIGHCAGRQRVGAQHRQRRKRDPETVLDV